MSAPGFSYNPEKYRSMFPHLKSGGIYLNHAALSPLPVQVIYAVHTALMHRQTVPIDHFEAEFAIIEETRVLLSRLIGASGGHQIAFTPNTSFALNTIAAGLPLHPDDEILIYEKEFPSNVYPWKLLEQKGVKLVRIPDRHGTFYLADLKRMSSPRTKVLALSAVQFLSGFRADLDKIGEYCRANGIWFVVDAIQALGHSPVDVQNSKIDALCSGSHKWLMSPQGSGFMYMSDAFRDCINLPHKGWLSVERVWDLFDTGQPLNAEMKRFEPGTYNIPAIYGLHASVSMLLDIGPDVIRSHILRLNGILSDELTSAGLVLYGSQDEHHRSAISSYLLPNGAQSERVASELHNNKVYVSSRDGNLRLSPYFYTTDDEIRRASKIIIETINRTI